MGVEMTITSSMNTLSNTGSIPTLHLPTVTVTTVTHTHWLPTVADPHHLPQVWFGFGLYSYYVLQDIAKCCGHLDILQNLEGRHIAHNIDGPYSEHYTSSQFCVAQLTKNEHVGVRVYILACAYVCLFLPLPPSLPPSLCMYASISLSLSLSFSFSLSL